MITSDCRGRFLGGGGVSSTLIDLSFLLLDGRAKRDRILWRKCFLILKVTMRLFLPSSSTFSLGRALRVLLVSPEC